jgi:YesN/AraC family two-component response regulator
LIQKEYAEKQSGWQILLVDYCREYFVKLLRNILAVTPSGTLEPDSGQANLAIEITKYMHKHYQENLSLEDVSKAFFITPRHVTRIFSDYFGTSFRKTLSIYRLNYAKNYLCYTDKPVEEIAALVGISAPQTLYRLFKEHEGITISEYRKYHRQI